MKKLLAWLVGLTLIGCIAIAYCVGPSRLYGLLRSRPCTGVVAKIQPFGQSETEIPASFLVEIHGDDRLVYLFASSDKNWLMIAAGDRVEAKLYPAAWWERETAHWQNAALVAKFLSPPGPVGKVANNSVAGTDSLPH